MMQLFHIHRFEPFSVTAWNQFVGSYGQEATRRMARVISACRCGQVRKVSVPLYEVDQMPVYYEDQMLDGTKR